MRKALSKALSAPVDASVERVLMNAFYRPRERKAGTVADVASLSERRERFLAAGPQVHGGTSR